MINNHYLPDSSCIPIIKEKLVVDKYGKNGLVMELKGKSMQEYSQFNLGMSNKDVL